MTLEPRWYNHDIAERTKTEGPMVFPISLVTELIRKKDPPKLGPEEDQFQWFEVKVTILMGGRQLGNPVYFPAHENLDPQVAFAAAMKAAMEG